jgi:hypothetical protein
MVFRFIKIKLEFRVSPLKEKIIQGWFLPSDGNKVVATSYVI